VADSSGITFDFVTNSGNTVRVSNQYADIGVRLINFRPITEGNFIASSPPKLIEPFNANFPIFIEAVGDSWTTASINVNPAFTKVIVRAYRGALPDLIADTAQWNQIFNFTSGPYNSTLSGSNNRILSLLDPSFQLIDTAVIFAGWRIIETASFLDSSSGIDFITIEGDEFSYGIDDFGFGNYFAINGVEITQAVFSEAEVTELVLNRKTAVLARVSSNVGAGTAELRVCIANQVDSSCDEVLATQNVDLGSFLGAAEFKLFFTPDQEGVFDILVELDSENLITEEQDDKKNISSVEIIETKQLKIPYLLVLPVECNSEPFPDDVDCSRREDDPEISSVVNKANELMQDIYPLPDNGLTLANNNALASYLIGGSKDLRIKEVRPSPCGPVNITFGLVDDMHRVMGALSESYKGAKRFVGLVPEGYFQYHKFPNDWDVTGFRYPDIPEVGFVVLDSANSAAPYKVAHEIAHTFGIVEEGYDAPDCVVIDPGPDVDGFNVGDGTRLSAREIMGSGGADNYWISTENWRTLADKLGADAPDPELLWIGGVIDEGGVVEWGRWTVFDGTPNLINPGEYSIVLKDEIGVILQETPFNVSFRYIAEPLGEFTAEIAPLAYAVPYLMETASVEILNPDGAILSTIDPATKVLGDAVDRIPDECFVADPLINRQAMSDLIAQLETHLDSDLHESGMSLLQTDFLGLVQSNMVPECDPANPLTTSREKLLFLIDRTLLHLNDRFTNFNLLFENGFE
jgi:hypothetical protein